MKIEITKAEALYELSALTHRHLSVEDVLYKLTYGQLEALASRWGKEVREKNNISLTEVKLGMQNAIEEHEFLSFLHRQEIKERKKYIF